MRITSKGQVTIPVAIREQAGLLPNTEVEVVLEHGEVKLRPLGKGSRRESRGEELVRRMRGASTLGLTTDEIMTLTRGNE